MAVEREIHYRSYPAELEVREAAGDGLTVTGLVVPYDTEAVVTEWQAGRAVTYREVFRAGAFQRAERKPTVVSLTYNHDTTLGNRLGYCRRIWDEAAGLMIEARLDRSSADKARDILTGSHGRFSIGFASIVPRAGSERAGELVERRAVILDHIAAVADPAYADTSVLAIRAEAAEDGEPSDAEIAAQARARADADLLAAIDALVAQQAKWDALRTAESKV